MVVEQVMDNRITWRRWGWIGLAGMLAGARMPAAVAEVSLAPVFTDHAVMQRSARVPVWGKAEPGEIVSVKMAGVQERAQADKDGNWRVNLDLEKVGRGPFELTVSGKNTVTLSDILVGQVWLCSGQSNMEWLVFNSTNGKEDAKTTPPNLRMFVVKAPGAVEPQTQFKPREKTLPVPVNQWQVGSAEAGTWFSAVGYYFGRTLVETLDEPVGLINASWGGTPSETWTSSEGLDRDPELKAAKEKSIRDVVTYPERQAKYLADYAEWEAKHDRQDKPAADPQTIAYSAEGWQVITLPKQVPSSAGAIWLRRHVQVGARFAKKPMKITLGIVDGADSVYWNGTKIGATGYRGAGIRNNRLYEVPQQLVNEGSNTIAVRVFNPVGPVTIDASSAPQWASPVRLFGQWHWKAEYELPALTEAQVKEFPAPPVKPPATYLMATGLYNGMINPLIPYAMRGAIWYQGETNTGRAFQYRTAFGLLIEDWRNRWELGDFPFYFCQLGGEGEKKVAPEPNNYWAECREAQLMTLSLPNTGMAVTIDLAERDVHFRNKRPVGERLAAIALAKTYGKPVPYSGPMYRSLVVEGSAVRLEFDHTDGGLVARPLPANWQPDSTSEETLPLVQPSEGSEVQGFMICGPDGLWQWAQGKIVGGSVLLWAKGVEHPVGVRYAWSNNPTCNLFNGAGFPAPTFRTDKFPAASRNAKYEGN